MNIADDVESGGPPAVHTLPSLFALATEPKGDDIEYEDFAGEDTEEGCVTWEYRNDIRIDASTCNSAPRYVYIHAGSVSLAAAVDFKLDADNGTSSLIHNFMSDGDVFSHHDLHTDEQR
ncbi:hypothetical protein EW146_g9892 [Bondarzewia mesenterica]|uniref:Uncharacterized protein n=1 Tax=Bondarzewia mesenterica TaxID=1095465 RepID=A0A4S4L468_9AGAM|nr:hypothetical protein EW146_g9892 [Bondarzewia mesenterica]